MISADQKGENVNRKFASRQCELEVLGAAGWLTGSHWFTLTCGIEGFKGGKESVCTHHHTVTVNQKEWFSPFYFFFFFFFISLCGSLRKFSTPPSNLQLSSSHRSLSLNLQSAASAFISSLGLTQTWLLSSENPSPTLLCPSTISPVLSSPSFHLPPPPPDSFSAVTSPSLLLWRRLPLTSSTFYVHTSFLPFTFLLCLYFLRYIALHRLIVLSDCVPPSVVSHFVYLS